MVSHFEYNRYIKYRHQFSNMSCSIYRLYSKYLWNASKSLSHKYYHTNMMIFYIFNDQNYIVIMPKEWKSHVCILSTFRTILYIEPFVVTCGLHTITSRVHQVALCILDGIAPGNNILPMTVSPRYLKILAARRIHLLETPLQISLHTL